MLRTAAGRLAAAGWLPTSVRAVLGYYAHSGVVDVGSLRLKRRVDAVTEGMLEEAFAEVEAALAAEFDRESVAFDYDTKLVLPAQLALGYCYRREAADREARAEALTRLAIEALVDGDMRDARNDAEYEDFAVDFPTDAEDRARVARVAQETLQARVEADFEAFDDEVRALYDWAVEVSEAHQEQDEHFRDLMAAAEGAGTGAAADLDPATARERIREEYKFGTFEEDPELFEPAELELPYLKTQYDRVGVIYDGMLGMYDAAGFEVDPAFVRSIVLAIIGAQIWLDDIDDYAADRRDGQLTPVTAEYLLAGDEAAARRAVLDISESYLDLARAEATAADSPLTGIATEYIYRSGTPEVLPPGSP